MKVISTNTVKASLLGAALMFSAMNVSFAQADQANDAKGAQSATANTMEKKVQLSLDHGPRAEVTPWVNAQRRLRAQQ